MGRNKSQARLLAPIIKSPDWELVVNYLAVEKERIVTGILNCNPSELPKLQGEYKALMKLEGMKETLKAEESYR